MGKNGNHREMSRPISRVLSRTIIHLRQVSPPACSDLPESTVGHSKRIPIWSCSEWGLPSPRLLPAARCALTAPFHPYPTTRKWSGGILSAALSVGSRPPGVTWHPALWSPDFPPPRKTGKAIVWPTRGALYRLAPVAASPMGVARIMARALLPGFFVQQIVVQLVLAQACHVRHYSCRFLCRQLLYQAVKQLRRGIVHLAATVHIT